MLLSGSVLSYFLFVFRGRRLVYVLYPLLSIALGYLGVLVFGGELVRGVVPVLYAAFVWAVLNTKAWGLAVVFFSASYLFMFPTSKQPESLGS